MYFYKHESVEGIDIAKKKKGYLLNNDRDLIAELEYDVEFWRDNPIVKPTILEEEAIKAFENDKSFVGKMFKKY
ncbi:MAG: hypothetical protein ACJAXB_000485 [Candidatus Endobugula sp.]